MLFQLLRAEQKLSLNIPKNGLFLLKNCKNRRELGTPPSDQTSPAQDEFLATLLVS